MKQTAVKWLLENLNSEPYSEEEFNYNRDCWDKALELEKEQIIKAYWSSYKEGQYSGDKTADEYYNQTYKNTEQ